VIGAILERVRRSGEEADLILKTDETVTLRLAGERVEQVGITQEEGINLRLRIGGRIGTAGTTGRDPDALLEAARASAPLGPRIDLFPPAPAPTAHPETAAPEAGAASLEELTAQGRLLATRLEAGRRATSIGVERSTGVIHVANSRGVDQCYSVTVVGLDCTVRVEVGSAPLVVQQFWAAVGLPGLSDLDGIAAHVEQRCHWAERECEAVGGRRAVCFTPAAVSALLLPVRHALRGKSAVHHQSPWSQRLGSPVAEATLSIVDDPHQDGRTGSRPIDDEGVVTRPLTLIDRGVLRSFIYDLETASIAGVPATGHGRRSTFGKPQSAFSNLRVLPGEHAFEELLDMVGEGLLVDRLHGAGVGASATGAFTHPATLAYWVSGGHVVGRVPRVTLGGNVFSLLGSIRGVGRDVAWVGSLALPSLVVDGVNVIPG